MKRLTIIRHAKSSWTDPQLDDIDRPLNERGKSDASLIGKYLLERGLHADMIISSPAKRARKTAKIVAKSLHISNIEIEDQFYTFHDNGDIMLSKIAKLPEDITSLIIFGHNETFSILAYRLSHGKIMEFPTCATMSVTFDIDHWHSINEELAVMDFFIKPKLLKDKD